MQELHEGDRYFGVLLEICRDYSLSRPRVRPVEGLPPDIRVEFPRKLREEHQLGTRFRADVKVCRKHFPDGRPKGPPYLRADTHTIVEANDYTPDRTIFAVERPGTISGRAYDWIELKQQNDNKVTSFTQLRRIAYQAAALIVPAIRRERWERERDEAIGAYALARSHGVCEGCKGPAPFLRRNNTPYLEIHHIVSLALGGADHPANVAALCPNCHRRTEHSKDALEFNIEIRRRIAALEEELGSVSF
jgi:5-methylcytosine-specific restriction endonuclease McrA